MEFCGEEGEADCWGEYGSLNDEYGELGGMTGVLEGDEGKLGWYFSSSSSSASSFTSSFMDTGSRVSD